MIEKVPQGNSEADGYSKYHNRSGVSFLYVSIGCLKEMVFILLKRENTEEILTE